MSWHTVQTVLEGKSEPGITCVFDSNISREGATITGARNSAQISAALACPLPPLESLDAGIKSILLFLTGLIRFNKRLTLAILERTSSSSLVLTGTLGLRCG